MARFECVVPALAVLSLTAMADAQKAKVPVTEQCLGCICEATSSCDVSITSGGCENGCGPFRITFPYWTDSMKPTVNNELPDAPTAYSNCARDTYCSALAVRGYMKELQKDCNGDGKIDCDDFVIMHIIGGYGCIGKAIEGINKNRYQQCKNSVFGGLASN